MFSVILLILKIIGIAILVLLGLLLFVLLTVLLVPIRYRVRVEHGEAFSLEGGVSWLLHFIHARISQCKGNRRIWIRIMGIPVYDSLRPPKSKKPEPERASSDDEGEQDITQENTYSKDMAGESTREDKTVYDEINDIDSRKTNSSEINDSDANNDSANSDNVNNDNVINDNANNDSVNNDNIDADDRGFFRRIINAFRRLKLKVMNFFRRIKDKVTGFVQKLKNIKNKASLILNFLNDENNRRGFRSTYEALKKALRHILPTKIKSRLVFGTGDPCSTGQILGIFSILYGIYGDKLQITPDFENKVFEGSHYIKGRIRICTLLIIIIRLLLDKRFKDLRMNYQLLKEAL